MLKIGAIKKRYGFDGYVKCVVRGEEIWRQWNGVQLLYRDDALNLAEKCLAEHQELNKTWPDV